jgi:hypothetical protein
LVIFVATFDLMGGCGNSPQEVLREMAQWAGPFGERLIAAYFMGAQ